MSARLRPASILLLLIGLAAACAQHALPTTRPAAPTLSIISPTPAATATSSPPATVPILETAVPPPATATPAPAATLSLPYYALDATLDYAAHRVSARQEVTLANDSQDAWAEVVFNVSPAYWPGLFRLQEATVAYAGQRQTPVPGWQATMLHLPLAPPLAPGAPLTVTLAFSLSLPRLDPLGWGPEGNAGWAPELVQVGDWYPALVPYRPGAGWDTWLYNGVGDPVRSGLADYAVTLTTAPTLTVAAAGGQPGETTYHLAQARAFAFLASPTYVRLGEPQAEIPLTVYVLAPHRESGRVVLETARQALSLFADSYGPYPYPELVIAENGFLTAMEYSALVSLSGYGFDHYEGTADSLLVAITAHEVAHQWWYGAVGNDQVEEPWLDEALAMVSELLFYERHYPKLVDWWWWYRVDRWQPAGFVDVSVHEYANSTAYVHDMYSTAAYFMRDLRALMGVEDFLHFLQDYYIQHRYGWATGENFFAAALDYADREALAGLVGGYFREVPEVLQ